MSAARKAILKAVARALPPERPDAAAIEAEARLLVADSQKLRPTLAAASIVESFIQRAAGSKAGTTIGRIAAISELPQAAARHLGSRKLPMRIALQPVPLLNSLDWAAAGIACDGAADDGIVVGLPRWGIAENGTLVFHSAADTPILLNFLPAVHIVAVYATSIVAHLEDYASAARRAGDPAPRNACLITGASGTTDIEGNLVLGAHGPRELHIIVIDDESANSAQEKKA
ncbi:MAG: LUD domain-containing protein [Rhodomicrobium sp.]